MQVITFTLGTDLQQVELPKSDAKSECEVLQLVQLIMRARLFLKQHMRSLKIKRFVNTVVCTNKLHKYIIVYLKNIMLTQAKYINN